MEMACSSTATVSDVLAVSGIPSHVLHSAGEWATDAFGKACRDWRQIVVENRSCLLAVLPRAIFTHCTSAAGNQWPLSSHVVLLTGQLTLYNRQPELALAGRRREWSAVSSMESARLSLKLQLCPTSVGLIPSPVSGWSTLGAGLTFLEGQLYLCGGWAEDEADSEASEIWDPKTEEWMPMPKAPPQVAARMWEAAGVRTSQLSICARTPRQNRTCPASLSCILPRTGNRSRKLAVGCVWRFDSAIGDWEAVEPMLEDRAEAAVGVLGGHIYVCGGMDEYEGPDGSTSELPDMDKARVTATCERFIPSTGKWEALPSLLCARAWAATSIAGGRLHVSGGFGEDWLPVRTAECFNPVTNAWELSKWQSPKSADPGFSMVTVPVSDAELLGDVTPFPHMI